MNLFEKYGGDEFWNHFLDLFYTRITTSEEVRHHFLNKNIRHIKAMLLGLLEVTLVSYSNFSDNVLTETHKNLEISSQDFESWLRIFLETLKEFEVSDSDAHYIVHTISNYKNHIVS